MISRALFVASAVAAVLALALLTGCPKKEQAQLQGAPAPPTHTMPGGEQMPGQMHGQMQPATPTATTGVEMASCPVLGTTMPKDKMIPYDYKGKTYYFCCPPCVEQFKKDPEKWIKNPTPPKPPAKGMGG